MKHPNLLNCVIAIWGLVPRPNARDQSLSSSLKLPCPLKVTVQGQGLSFSTNKTARHHSAPLPVSVDTRAASRAFWGGGGMGAQTGDTANSPTLGPPGLQSFINTSHCRERSPAQGTQPAKYIFTTSDILGILPTEPLFSLVFWNIEKNPGTK